MTAAESKLWEALRDRHLGGYKFRRQCPIGPFVADFCQHDSRLVIELDGGIHLQQSAPDANRQSLLEGWGFTILRFPNAHVINDLPAVLEEIKAAVDRIHSD